METCPALPASGGCVGGGVEPCVLPSAQSSRAPQAFQASQLPLCKLQGWASAPAGRRCIRTGTPESGLAGTGPGGRVGSCSCPRGGGGLGCPIPGTKERGLRGPSGAAQEEGCAQTHGDNFSSWWGRSHAAKLPTGTGTVSRSAPHPPSPVTPALSPRSQPVFLPVWPRVPGWCP